MKDSACIWTGDGMEGLKKSIELAADMREKCGDEFLLMWDCWMALDLQYAKRLMQASADLKFNWIEECFNPDDYWSYRDLKKAAGNQIMVTGGEHEASKFGFRMLIEDCDLDVIQPDVGWCGGMTELIKMVIWLKLMENMSFLMEAVHTAIITLQPRQTHRSQSA